MTGSCRRSLQSRSSRLRVRFCSLGLARPLSAGSGEIRAADAGGSVTQSCMSRGRPPGLPRVFYAPVLRIAAGLAGRELMGRGRVRMPTEGLATIVCPFALFLLDGGDSVLKMDSNLLAGGWSPSVSCRGGCPHKRSNGVRGVGHKEMGDVVQQGNPVSTHPWRVW